MASKTKNDNSLILLLAGFLFIVLAVTFYLVTTYRNELFSREINGVITQSESTEVSSIESDLEETDLDNLDSELQDIENELNQL